MSLSDLQDATRRLVRTVDALDDTAYAEASLLPGWTRGHVVAHLALNAEALAGVLRGVAEGRPVAMYAGDEYRDGDIAALGPAGPVVLRSRLYGATTDLGEALAVLPPDLGATVVHRTPGGGRTFLAGEVAGLRLTEVEVHHVDLGAGYAPTDWPPAFADALVERLHGRAAATLSAVDSGRTWQGGPGTPTVSGRAADLGWWLSGRGEGTALTTHDDDGVLPRIEAW